MQLPHSDSRSSAFIRGQFLSALLIALSVSCWAIPCRAAEPTNPHAKWEAEIAAMEAAAAKSPPPQNAVLFTGSSSIRLWKTLAADFPELAVINRGFGGSHIADNTHFAERTILPHRPKAIVLYAGDNDLKSGKSPQQLRDDFLAFVENIHAELPQTKIIFIAVKPCPSRANLMDKQREANSLIAAEIKKDDRLAYCDIYDAMLDAAGKPRPELFVADMLHMNEKGYALWTEKLRPMLKAFAKSPGEPREAAENTSPTKPLFETQDLFTAGQGGYLLYRIPGIICTPRGTLLAYCEARQTPGDWGAIDILYRRGTDGGRAWSPQKKLAEKPGDWKKSPVAVEHKQAAANEATLNNPVMIADATPGVVHLLYCVEYERCFYAKSSDDGETFSAPREITEVFEKFRPDYAWRVLATGPGHGIQLSKASAKPGRLVVPVWLSLATERNGHRPSCVSTIYSDDGGATWHPGEIVVKATESLHPSETVPVELSDGRVLLNFRNESPERRRGVCISADGATGWSKPRFDEALPEPICMGSILSVPHSQTAGSGDKKSAPAILFVNPHNTENRDRKNLTVKLSRDDCQTWPVSRVIEPGPSAYSDLAADSDGTIYCLFERGAIGNAYKPRTLRLVRFSVDWMVQPLSR